jgi:hypothetical protein
MEEMKEEMKMEREKKKMAEEEEKEEVSVLSNFLNSYLKITVFM